MDSLWKCLQQALRVMIISFHSLRFLLMLPCFISSSTSSSPDQPYIVGFLTGPMHNSSDQMALLAFRSSLTSDPHRALASWDVTYHWCRWRGVMCGGRRHPERVNGLDLASLGLTGPIPTSIANLTFLRRLDLSNNNFSGNIPQELGRLSRLRHLNLSFNSLSGWIPDTLGCCSDLLSISLRENMLAGAIPPWLTNLTSLQILSLYGNRLGGTIPSWLGNMARLTELHLGTNSLTGPIPPELGNLQRLTVLEMSNNSLSGTIPPSLSNLTQLQLLVLSKNRLAGSIPPSFGSLSTLTGLDLSENSLTESIPPSLGNLTYLTWLYIKSNSLSGAIPPELGNLPRLELLEMVSNSLSGSIPLTLSNRSSLQYLDLSTNRLTGSIPPSFGGLPSLRGLLLANNTLTGNIPPSLGNLTYLTWLYLGNNFLVGAIPATMGNLISLKHFITDENRLIGVIPSSLYNLSSLTDLDLRQNHLFGALPSDIGVSLPNLRFFSLSHNKFHGSIPSSILNASSLQIIQLGDNKFSGVVPYGFGNLKDLTRLLLYNNLLEAKGNDDWSFLASLANCTSLRTLNLANNKFGGVLPQSISNLSVELNYLYLGSDRISGGNRISGSIPEGIGGLVGLTVLHFDWNLLGGTIPAAIGNLHQLSVLSLSWNRFSGQIPTSISNITRLTNLYVGGNNLQGAIPPSLGNLQQLLELDLSHNKFTGVVPRELVSISSLTQTLDLSHNSLSGTLPVEVGRLRNLHGMDISGNKLSGTIPWTLGDCELLLELYMHDNAFRGVIPDSLSKLGALESLDLSHNNLSGEIPKFIQNFRFLNYINLSFNNFDGEVPKTGVFQNASAVFVLGNPKLCGGIQELHLQACPQRKTRGRHKFSRLIIIIIAVSIAALCLVILILYLIFLHNSRRKRSPPKAPSNELLARTTYSELFKATDGFSSRNLIGVGSFGSVYKANMDTTDPIGKFVAVKVINLQQQGASKSFMAECEALRNIRHRNLLKIMTSCSSIDFNGNDFKALVFEFMPNGSLEQWLHPIGNENVEKHLSLVQRLNIATDVASALSYLHHQSYDPVVHCDLKPSNVLLDNDMTAHLSDFGLAKFLTNKDDNKTPSSSLGLRGSIGYVAPEYGMGCRASTEGDVFSYGVLLLEIITGRRPTDASFIDGFTIHNFVEVGLLNHILDIVDPNLLIEDDWDAYDTSQTMNNMRQGRLTCLVSMARLGLRCSKESPKERVGMDAVTKEVATIRDTFLGARVYGRMMNFNRDKNVASTSGFYGNH